MKYILSLLMIFISSSVAISQLISFNNPDGLNVNIRGRATLDTKYEKNIVQSRNINFFFSDVRVGLDASYKKFHLRADISFINKEALLRDIFIEYQSKNHGLRIGNYFQHYLMDNITESYDKSFHNNPQSVAYSNNNRNLGLSYFFHTKKLGLWADLFTDFDVNEAYDNKNGLGGVLRVVYRPLTFNNNLIHLGLAARYRIFEDNNNPLNDWRYDTPDGKELGFSPEILWQYKRFRLQAEYIFGHLQNKILSEDKTYLNKIYNGVYSQLSFLIIGKRYNYNYLEGVSLRPDGCSWDFSTRLDIYEEIKRFKDNKESYYNYLSYSIGSSLWVNKYIGLLCDYTRVTEIKKNVANIRIQFIF